MAGLVNLSVVLPAETQSVRLFKTSFPLSFGCELLQQIKRVFPFPKLIKEALLSFC